MMGKSRIEEEIILPESDEAATYRTDIKGWVDRHGRYFGNLEKYARLQGATHKKCECGELVKANYYGKCSSCREQRDIEKYNAMPNKDWDGETPLYSDAHDEYFFDEDELECFIDEEEDRTIENLRLIICKPNYFNTIDESYFDDDLPENCEDLPPELTEAIEEFNNVIRGLKPASWSPGEYAANVEQFK